MKPASGKFIIRIDPALHARLQSMSLKRHISLNRLCVEQIQAISGVGPSSGIGEVRFGIPVGELKTTLQEAGIRLHGCVVFGSAVRGELSEKSDIDLLLVLKAEETLTRDLYDEWRKKIEPHLKSKVTKEVSPQFVTLPNSPAESGSLWYEVAIQGSILWDEDNEVSRFLRQVREWIAAGNAQRKVSHGHPYWVRK